MDEWVREAARLTTNYISKRSVAIVIRDRAGNSATGTSTCIQLGPVLLDEALVTSPELLQVVAITTKWKQSARMLIATKIEHWLELVAQDFPEARVDIQR